MLVAFFVFIGVVEAPMYTSNKAYRPMGAVVRDTSSIL